MAEHYLRDHPPHVPRSIPLASVGEPFWPVAIALAVLGVSTASLIAVVIGFDDGRWHSSGWYWLGLLASVMGAMLLLALTTRARVRRRVQMGLIVSIMLHFALAVFLKDQFLSFVVTAREKQVAEVEPMPTLPDYYLPPMNAPAEAQAFERPVETELVESPRAEAARQLEAAEFSPTRPRTSLNRQQTQISQEQFQRQQQAVPRRADSLSQLSRQDAPVARINNESVRAPQQPLELQPAPRTDVAASQRRRAAPAAPMLNRPSLSSSPARQTTADGMVRPMRQISPDTLSQDVPDSGPPERRDSTARIAQASATDVAVPAPAQEAANRNASPAATPLARQRTTAPRSSSTRIAGAQIPATSSVADANVRTTRQPPPFQPNVETQQRMTAVRRQENVASLAETRATVTAGRGDTGADGRGAVASGDAGTGNAQAPAGTRLARRSTVGPRARQARGGQRQPNASTTASLGENRSAVDRADRATVSSGELPSGATESQSGVARRSLLAELQSDSLSAPAIATDEGDLSGRGRGASPGEMAAHSSTPGRLDRTPSRIPVRVAADLGAGGLSTRRAASPGIASRRANPSSQSLSSSPSRFLRRALTTAPTVNSRARDIAPSFAGRVARRRNQTPEGAGQPSADVEETIEQGLAYLATVQLDDGRWSLQHSVIKGAERRDRDPTIVADTAATGLALLAFLGAGYDHYEGQYRDNIAQALQFLVEHQKSNGDLFIQQRGTANEGVWLYSHGIAAIALCEAYGMTGDTKLKQSAQRALDFIVAAQEPERGGWRYAPGIMADLSVSGWQLMALRSGQLAGLEVPSSAMDKTVKLLNATQRSPKDASQYVYNPWGPDTERGRFGPRPNTVMTSVGLLMRLYTGWRRGHPALQLGAHQLADRLPEMRRPKNSAGTENPLRDTYYWYNATQVMFHMQGELWTRWQSRLYPLLAGTQVESGPMAGSWDPLKPVPDRWGMYAGRVYVTTMNLLSLEVYHRHLPLYSEDLAAVR